MKKVASVTPKKAKRFKASSPMTRSLRKRTRMTEAGSLTGKTVRRKLFHTKSPEKKKSAAQQARESRKEETGRKLDSESEDADVFAGKYKGAKPQCGGQGRAPSDERSVQEECEEDSHADNQEDEEEDTDAEQQSLDPLPAVVDSEPDGAALVDSASKNFSMDDKMNMVDVGLLAMLTPKCCRFLGSASGVMKNCSFSY